MEPHLLLPSPKCDGNRLIVHIEQYRDFAPLVEDDWYALRADLSVRDVSMHSSNALWARFIDIDNVTQTEATSDDLLRRMGY